ncbi:MAG: MgtC/SapB family protein [Atopobiaceae bacterium]|nr:MgtC/SapB family protein [Atopobiaceae bacterium]
MSFDLITPAGSITVFDVFLRLGIATLAGILIGFERETRNKVAGIKTHVLVCVGSALCMIVGEYTFLLFPNSADITRIGSGVVSGVGFLGVGTIIVRDHTEVHGLTTAAGLWCCACIGLSAGIGYLGGTLVALFFSMFTMLVLRYVDKWLRSLARDFELYVEIDENHNIKHLLHELRRLDVYYTDVRINKSGAPGDGPIVMMAVHTSKPGMRDGILDNLRELDYVRFIEDLG